MADVVPRAAQVTGETQGTGATMLLDPVYLFKGKLRAAATRGKFHDASDLRWLENNYLSRLQENRGQLSLLYVGLALKRYPELQHCFTRIGINYSYPVYEALFDDPAPSEMRRQPPKKRKIPNLDTVLVEIFMANLASNIEIMGGGKRRRSWRSTCLIAESKPSQAKPQHPSRGVFCVPPI
ncbi:hypothetical protein BDBG_09509 [Blastomyces gilchristii SLH14081]|uniref:Uncharacterized protein n=1 Tax=Blastomyces gilchristii (strain SLH14081) TaxID=559298 RepID=A0A179V2F9_BLAGS|nr:uncharacterized protein BDBG_09509 [Blastomyces gilchristii SLH14081]OAT14496.1 hypothetical protein BDBG_09509 [Blastomyces gilchristii SLH14081]